MLTFENGFEVIPAVKHIKQLEHILALKSRYVMLNDIHIGNLSGVVSKCHQAGKFVIVNMDMVGGLALDKIGIEMLKHLFKVDAVQGSNVPKLNMAKQVGLDVVFRIALMDSRYLDTSLKVAETCKCDCIEIRPAEYGLRFKDAILKVKQVPLLLGGFVDQMDLLHRAKAAGFVGVDTSFSALWDAKID